MSRNSNASGFIAQKTLMTYATPQIKHIDDSKGFTRWNDARVAADLLWEPIFVPLNVGPIEVPDARGVLSPRTGYISTVSMRYALIDHNLLGKFVTAAQHMTGGDPDPISALVCLNNGARIGVRITRTEFHLPFDPSPIAQETWIWLRHDAKGSLYATENAQRMFCTNQLGFIGRSFSTDLAVRHTGDVDQKVRELIAIMQAKADWEMWEKEMTGLQETTVNAIRWQAFLDEYLPLPVNEDAVINRAVNARDRLTGLFQGYQQELGSTRYAAYQAVTEYEDQHRTARGGAGRFNRAIQPNPRKAVALEMLKALA